MLQIIYIGVSSATSLKKTPEEMQSPSEFYRGVFIIACSTGVRRDFWREVLGLQKSLQSSGHGSVQLSATRAPLTTPHCLLASEPL